ncbi:MAG: RNA ligase family protein [Candidatus Paceibacterota bacterium]|jgi:hypothetical protein
MKQYPSITKNIVKGEPFYCFDKIDGSNIRAEWSRKNGFYKFGTRHRLLDKNEPILGKAVYIIQSKYELLNLLFLKKRQTEAVCFFEFYGSKSFAGNHVENDNFDVVLFDVSLYKKGMMQPKEFIEWFQDFDIAKLLYHGNITDEFYNSVKNSKLQNMTFEGVVCKSTKKNQPLMFKIKSNIWLQKLKDFCKDDILLFNKLE